MTRIMQVPGVRFKRFTQPEPSAGISLVWREDRPSPTVLSFLEFVRAS
jgi:hypothetical protein